MTTTVIVPTYDESANARTLMHRIDAAMLGRDAEILFVDDGSDDLPAVVDRCRGEISLPVRVIRRAEPVGRLGGAVVEGLRQSDSDVVVVCDGDLQHPPELIPQLVDAAAHVELVVASRYVGDGDAGGLSNGLRRFVSRATGAMSRATFPQRLRRCTDPMSGFFAVRREAVAVDALRPKGFKILLEIMARSQPMSMTEIPFTFGERLAGQSHAGLGEGLRFLRQLLALRLSVSSTAGRAARYFLLGASGILPNLLVLRLLVASGVGYLIAAVIAVQVSIAWNLAGAELLVWRSDHVHTLRVRAVRFVAIGETDLLRLPFVYLLVDHVGIGSTLATLITLCGAFLFRFTVADKLVYRRRPVVVPVAVATVTEAALTSAS